MVLLNVMGLVSPHVWGEASLGNPFPLLRADPPCPDPPIPYRVLSEDVEGFVRDVVWPGALVALPTCCHPRKFPLTERLPRGGCTKAPDALASGLEVCVSGRPIALVEDGSKMGQQRPLPVVAVRECCYPRLPPLPRLCCR